MHPKQATTYTLSGITHQTANMDIHWTRMSDCAANELSEERGRETERRENELIRQPSIISKLNNIASKRIIRSIVDEVVRYRVFKVLFQRWSLVCNEFLYFFEILNKYSSEVSLRDFRTTIGLLSINLLPIRTISFSPSVLLCYLLLRFIRCACFLYLQLLNQWSSTQNGWRATCWNVVEAAGRRNATLIQNRPSDLAVALGNKIVLFPFFLEYPVLVWYFSFELLRTFRRGLNSNRLREYQASFHRAIIATIVILYITMRSRLV